MTKEQEYETLVEGRYFAVFYGEGDDELRPPHALFKTEEEAVQWCESPRIVEEYGKHSWQILRLDMAGSYWNSFDDDPRKEFVSPIEMLEIENRRMKTVLNTPEIKDFLKAVEIEAAHQRNRWGDAHDEGKNAGDWALLLDKIKGKQCQAHWERDGEKYLHHLITMAAICFNAHRCMSKKVKLNRSGE